MSQAIGRSTKGDIIKGLFTYEKKIIILTNVKTHFKKVQRQALHHSKNLPYQDFARRVSSRRWRVNFNLL